VERRPDDGYRLFQWSHHSKPEPFWPTEEHAYQRWLREQNVDWDETYAGGETQGNWAGWDLQSGYSPGIDAAYHQTTWCANEAIAFMQENRDGPWLMSVNPYDPHPPFDPPRDYFERMDIEAMPLPLFHPDELESQLDFQNIYHQTKLPHSPHDYDARCMVTAYCAQIELIDRQVGRMLDALKESGQRDETVVIFTSDHGEMLGDHGLLYKGCRFYEGAVHVPLVISWPGHFEEGLRSEALVELTDIVPTLYEALSLSVPDSVQGVSLLPILQGDQDPSVHRDMVRCEYHDALDRPLVSHANMLFDGRYKLVVYHGHEIGELYDLERDPKEFHNLWQQEEYSDLRCDLTKRLFDDIILTRNLGVPRTGRF
jgi:arylsulfatase A-like enzyme